jgi:hypothetical protein
MRYVTLSLTLNSRESAVSLTVLSRESAVSLTLPSQFKTRIYFEFKDRCENTLLVECEKNSGLGEEVR